MSATEDGTVLRPACAAEKPGKRGASSWRFPYGAEDHEAEPDIGAHANIIQDHTRVSKVQVLLEQRSGFPMVPAGVW